jgi:hypothetical protein
VKVELVTHVFSEQLPQYAALLHLQLSSLILFPPKCEVQLTLCATESDEQTLKQWEWFYPRRGKVTQKLILMPKHELFRRAIGRNEAALRSDADLVWLTDADFIFGEGCLDGALSEMERIKDEQPKPQLMFLDKLTTTQDHAKGDALWQEVLAGRMDEVVDVTQRNVWKQRDVQKSFGGMYLIPGDVAREKGVLRGTKWLNPHKVGTPPFPDFLDDLKLRHYLGSPDGRKQNGHHHEYRINVPNLYRVRHHSVTYKAGHLDKGK